MNDANVPFVRKVVLRNYKSIRECDVSLGPLMFLVGPNGSGKSNFLEALRFVAESLRNPMERAFDMRGGPANVFSRFREPPEKLEIDLGLNLPHGQTASFRFIVLPKPPDGFVVKEEDCAIFSEGDTRPKYRYKVREGEVVDASFGLRPPASQDRLYLTIASSFPEFRGLYDLLAGVLFYKINPARIREGSFEGSGALRTDGAGLGRVLRRIGVDCPELIQRIDEYARAVLPSLNQISVESLSECMQRLGTPDPKVTKEMEKQFLWFVILAGDQRIYFPPKSISDGTLHALGVLVVLFQCANRPPLRTISLVGIEEPEATLHPAAAGVLFDALHEAAHFVQVVATTHSAELLDTKHVDPESLLIVDMVDGETVIGPADEPSMSAMRDQMYTAGELLKLNQLRPEPNTPEPADHDTLPLFPAE